MSNSHSLLNSTICFYGHQPRGDTWLLGSPPPAKNHTLQRCKGMSPKWGSTVPFSVNDQKEEEYNNSHHSSNWCHSFNHSQHSCNHSQIHYRETCNKDFKPQGPCFKHRMLLISRSSYFSPKELFQKHHQLLWIPQPRQGLLMWVIGKRRCIKSISQYATPSVQPRATAPCPIGT